MSSNKLDRKIKELSALYEISKTLASSLDLHATAAATFDILHQHLDLRRGTLVVKNRDKGDFTIFAAHGLTKKEIERGKYKSGEGVTGKVLESGQPVIVPDVGKEPLFLNKTKSRGDLSKENISFIGVPISVKGEILGVLSVDRIFADDEISFEEDARFLSVLASLIGQALKLSWVVAQEKKHLIEENVHLQTELRHKYHLANVVGSSRKMREVYEMVERVAKSKSTVLLRGESGTGKELIARAIHYGSARAEQPFIKVNCAALPETLLESELFGHERGAFTGANEQRRGRFELADKGTLFLDEIGDIPLSTQVKLLRVLQEKKFERLGGSKTLAVDVRLLAATNRDLEAAIKTGEFREDLYYRLNVIPLFLPPLREREEDVLMLVEYFLSRFNSENEKAVMLSRSALEMMQTYTWPGNVRELENCIERLVVLTSDKGQIEIDDLPLALRSGITPSYTSGVAAVQISGGDSNLVDTVHGLEKDRILAALKEFHGVQSKAARVLGLSARQLGYKMKKYGVTIRNPTA